MQIPNIQNIQNAYTKCLYKTYKQRHQKIKNSDSKKTKTA